MPSVARPSGPLARDLTGRKLGRYEVLAQLASGGMATVYVARAQGVAGFERLVAIKVLHPHLAHDEDFISMFLDEARLAARIRHPNAVGTLDISDSQGDGYFLVMEYVEGDHFGALLRSAAKAGQKPPVPVIARVAMDALAGLGAAHDLKDPSGDRLELVHRDVSPHNILIGTDGVARITDFGVAKAQVRLSSTRDGQFKGKLSYMAPEQAASGEADQRSDLFSMGIVLWESLTGRRLFRGENNADVLNKVLACEVPPPSAFDAALGAYDAVVLRALAREPNDRFQRADEMAEAIEEAAKTTGGVAMPRAVLREVERWLGDKIAHERQSIQAATDSLGRSEVGKLQRPYETGSQPSHPPGSQSSPRSAVRPITADVTIGARPSKVQREPEPRRTPILWLAIGAIALAGVGSLGALSVFVFMQPSTPPVAAPPPPAVTLTAPPPPPTAVEHPVVAPVDEPAAVPPAQAVTQANAPPDRPRPGRHRRHGATQAGPADENAGGEPDDEPLVNPYRH